MKWRNWNITHLTPCAWATNTAHLVEIDQYWRALYMENKVVFRLYLAFRCSDVRKTSHLSLHAHALQTEQFWLKLVNNESNVTWLKSRFSSVFRIPMQWGNRNITPLTACAWATNTANLVEIGQYWRALYLENKEFFRLYLAFRCSGVTQT
jgi:hypothetical protein